ncbi:hypothetical protein MOQ_004011, partial [Trypanosoma cruzi marinkellei]
MVQRHQATKQTQTCALLHQRRHRVEAPINDDPRRAAAAVGVPLEIRFVATELGRPLKEGATKTMAAAASVLVAHAGHTVVHGVKGRHEKRRRNVQNGLSFRRRQWRQQLGERILHIWVEHQRLMGGEFQHHVLETHRPRRHPSPRDLLRVAIRGASQRKDVCIPVRVLCHPILKHAAHSRILHGKVLQRRATHNWLPRRHEVLGQRQIVLHETMNTQ